MQDYNDYDWANGTPADQQQAARRMSPEQLRQVARSYDWRLYPQEVLGWIMAQKCIDLGGALSAFLNGEPERFNYIPKRDVPDQHRPVVRLLDNICLRINSGFYLTLPGMSIKNERRLDRWMRYQDFDREEGSLGRWTLDQRVIDSLYDQHDLPESVTISGSKSHSLLGDVLSPIKELGVQREYLKYLPSDQ